MNYEMIYLDNAATTWPKPASVVRAAAEGVRMGANPGRGSYDFAERASKRVYECRRSAAEFFGLRSPENVIFTAGCTAAINCVLLGCLGAGDHLIISGLEHNAVVRPAEVLRRRGVEISRAEVYPGDVGSTLRSFHRLIRRNTKMIFCTHVSNVFGVILPVEEIGKMCREHGVLFGVDAAQSAGVLPTDIRRMNADFICAPAHKGLYGSMGLGLLLVGGETIPRPIMTGGTGSMSASRVQPDELPDRLESGTLNLPGIMALEEGISAVRRNGVERIAGHELMIMNRIYDRLKDAPNVELYTGRPDGISFAPLLSFNIAGMESGETAEILAERKIAVRAGYHCAYDAHIAFGTAEHGTVRLSPSMFTTTREADAAADIIIRMAESDSIRKL